MSSPAKSNVVLKLLNLPIDIQVLYEVKLRMKVYWRGIRLSHPGTLNSTLTSGQFIDPRDWQRDLQELARKGLLTKTHEPTPRASELGQKTTTYYRLTPSGRQLLESLGL